jgi:hypothetical protein
MLPLLRAQGMPGKSSMNCGLSCQVLRTKHSQASVSLSTGRYESISCQFKSEREQRQFPSIRYASDVERSTGKLRAVSIRKPTTISAVQHATGGRHDGPICPVYASVWTTASRSQSLRPATATAPLCASERDAPSHAVPISEPTAPITHADTVSLQLRCAARLFPYRHEVSAATIPHRLWTTCWLRRPE